MKKNLLYFTKLLAIMVVYLLVNLKVDAQTWTIYDGMKSLTDASNSLGVAWGTGDASGTLTTAQNTDGTGNGSMSWEATPINRQSIKSKPALTNASDLSTTGTLMFRAKSNNTGATATDYGFEIEFYTYVTGTSTNRIIFVQSGDGNIYLNGTAYPYSLASQQVYHTYRITVATGGVYNVYIDESATPLATITSTSTSSNKMYFRTGHLTNLSADPMSCKAELDWLAFDNTTAYTPGTGTLPAGVIVDGSTTPAAPSAPNATAATATTTTGFTANWDAAATATGYKLDVATDNAFASMVAGFSDKDVANVTTYNVTGLTAGTTYYYRVRAYNTGGTSASSSNVITVGTTGTTVAVTGVTVTGAGSATTITTNGGTLQMSADVAPSNATNKSVTWSVTNGTGEASISASGLLTASKNGTVTAKATADDGSGIIGTLEITISGQVSSTKKRVGYFTFVKTLDATATDVQHDPVFLMLQADPNLDVTLNALTDVSATATVDQSLYDVLVIQESFAGAAAILTPAGALGLAKLTKPTLYNKNYAFAKARAFKANSTGAGAETQGSNTTESTLVSIKVDPSVQSHDLFKDITFVADSVGLFTSGATDPGLTTGTGAIFKAINYATNVVISNTNTLLAKPVTVKTADQTILTVSFNDLPSGTVIGGTADQSVLGETLQTRVITVGMNFGAICASGGNNINANGLKIFKNAVYSLAGLYSTPTTVLVTGITVTGASSATTITTKGGTLQMIAAVTPANATNKDVVWSVNGTGEATINASGSLTATKNGTVTVKATAADGSGIMGTLDVTISGQTLPVTGVTVTGTDGATTITTNAGTLQMVATVAPTDATNKNVTWSVTNGTGQATINASGLLTASKNGTVTVKATSDDVNTIFGELVVTISGQNVPVTGVTVSGTSGATTITTKGGKLQMVATITPTDATNKNVTWSVTNGTGQATISATGELQASKDGTVTVKATSADVNTIFGELVITISGQSTGITKISGKGLEIYPNPVLDDITMDGASAVKKFEVISLGGKVLVQGVNSADKLSINVSKLSSGIYLLKVYTAEGAQQVKFMKK